MTTSGDASPPTETVSKLVRKPPGIAWLLALLLIPILLTALLLGLRTGSIQDDLEARSLAALEAQGITGAEVDLSGRDATVTVPAGADADRVRDIVSGVSGVRVASVSAGASTGTPTSPPPSSAPTTPAPSPAPSSAVSSSTPAPPAAVARPFSVKRVGNSVEVTGSVPDQAAKTALLNSFKASGVTVVDKVTVDPRAKAPDAAAIAAGLGRLKGDASIAFDGTSVTVTGKVPDAATKNSIGATVGRAFPGAAVRNNLQVSAPAADACAGIQARITRTLASNKIQFQPGAPVLTAASRTTITRVAALLRSCGTVRVEVGGHTDNQGNPATSQPLSQQRANTVRNELVRLGVAATRITAKGYGEAKPIAPNTSPAGRAANRRVELKVL